MEDTSNWAKPENAEVEQAKQDLQDFYANADIWDHEFDDPNETQDDDE